MRNYDVILFDLDGTLTDSAPGILNSVRYACRKLGLPIPGEETLRRFLGPPLIASFRELMGLDAADADRAVSAFREYFPTKGLFENEVYPGVPALLADLKAAGKTVILATSKPEAFARRIMEHFDLAQYCDFICGATLDETRTDKAEVIAYALETAGITDKTGLVMVGDREHDVLGAKKNGLPCIGAVYGYGTAEELTAAQRKQVVDYFALTKQEGTVRGMLRGVLASTAALAIIPMADWLEETAAARMNTPGQAQGNWQWRADAKKLTPALAAEIRVLTERYFRAAK